MSKYSVKTRNHKYAPGIATYGLKGFVGKDGKHGNGVFICSYNLSDGNDDTKKIALEKLNDNKYLISEIDKVTPRAYQVGDLIIDITGSIYILETDEEVKVEAVKLKFSEKAIAEINLMKELDVAPFEVKGFNRVVNKPNVSGIDIVSSSDIMQSDEFNDLNSLLYPLRVFVDDTNTLVDGYNVVKPLLSLNAINDNDHKYLNVKYNKSDDTIEFDSNTAIKFNTKYLELDVTESNSNTNIPLGYMNINVNKENNKQIIEFVYSYIEVDNGYIFNSTFKKDFIELVEVRDIAVDVLKDLDPLIVLNEINNGSVREHAFPYDKPENSEDVETVVDNFIKQITIVLTEVNKYINNNKTNKFFLEIIDKIDLVIRYE